MSDLIVIGYPNEDTAQRVYDELMKLENDLVVDLEDAAIIRRDQSGKLHVTTPAHHAVAWGSLSGLFWGVLIGLLFLFPLAPLVGVAGGIIGAAMGEAGNLGLKDDFKRRVQDLVQPGTSALLIIVRKVPVALTAFPMLNRGVVCCDSIGRRGTFLGVRRSLCHGQLLVQ